MAKQKKRRDKKYQGRDARSSRPTVQRVTAVSRSPLGQWLYERRSLLRSLLSGLVVLALIILTIVGIISLL